MTRDQLHSEIIPALITQGYARKLFAGLGPVRQSGSDDETTTCPNCHKAHKLSYSLSLPVWQCFKCGPVTGFRGNWIDWLIKQRGLSFIEALKLLAQEAGVQLSDSRRESDFKHYYRKSELFEFANGLFVKTLAHEKGRAVMEYLQQHRNLSTEEIRSMGLGAYVDRRQLEQLLLERGYSRPEINASGVLMAGLGDTHQLSMPWTDSSGHVIGLCCRALGGKAELARRGIARHYLYNAGLTKGTGLIGISRARNRHRVLLVESALDALRLNHHGLAAVAVGGVDLSEDQLVALCNSGIRELLVCLDNEPDAPGELATERVIAKLNSKAGSPRPYVVTLPDGVKDPDELLARDGREGMQAAIDKARGWPAWQGWVLGRRIASSPDLTRDSILEKAAQLMHSADRLDARELSDAMVSASGLEQQALSERIARLRDSGQLRLEQKDNKKNRASGDTGNHDTGSEPPMGGGVSSEQGEFTIDPPAHASDRASGPAAGASPAGSGGSSNGESGGEGGGGNGDGATSRRPAGANASAQAQTGESRQGGSETAANTDDETSKESKFKASAKERLNLGLNDFGLGQRLVDQYGADFRFFSVLGANDGPGGKCKVWDGQRWGPNDKLQIEQKAEEVCLGIEQEAEGFSGRYALALVSFAAQARNNKPVDNMIKAAVRRPGQQASLDMMDQQPQLFNLANCSYDLQSGSSHNHRREDMLTMLSPVRHDETATCPLWLAFLRESFGWPYEELYELDDKDRPLAPLPVPRTHHEDGDVRQQAEESVRALQRLFGYALTGWVDHQSWYLLHGEAQTGKSRVIDVLMALSGEYGETLDVDLIQPGRNSKVNKETEVLKMRGRRVLTIDEIERNRRFEEAFLKLITGETYLQGRELYGKTVKFRPTAKLFSTSNHEPPVGGADGGFWRRLVVIPFGHPVPNERKNTQLPGLLLRELPGIFNWAAEGAFLWCLLRSGGDDPLQAPKHWRDAAQEVRENQDVIGRFLEECCQSTPKDDPAWSYTYCRSPDLFAVYRKWCKDNGIDYPLTSQSLNKEVVMRGHEKDKKNGQIVIFGLLPKEEWLGALDK